MRELSIARHTAARVERHPVGAPRWKGELAKAAVNTGPTRWTRRHLSSTSCPEPMSRLTCTEVVEHIIVRPSVPKLLKYLSMAV